MSHPASSVSARQRKPLDAAFGAWAAFPRVARLGCLFLGTRAWVLAFMVLGTYFARKTPGYWPFHEGNLAFRQIPIRVLDVLGRWDTDFYLAIAQTGYPPLQPGQRWAYAAAYFPLLPALIRGLTVLFPIRLFFAGILIVNGALVLAVAYLDKLARLDRSPHGAELAIACLLAYPGSHFLSCVYPESLTLFLGAFALYCARRRILLPCALACSLGALARSTGWIICLPVLYELSLGNDGKLYFTWRSLWLLLPVATVAGYMLLHRQIYGDPLYFIHVEAGWNRKPSFPLFTLFQFTNTPDYYILGWGEILLLIVGFKRRERPGYLAMATTNVLLPLSSGLLNGIHRYMGSNFPLFFILSKELEKKQRWKQIYFTLSLSALALFSFKWGQGYHPN